MSSEELRTIVDAVLAELQAKSPEIGKTTVQQSLNGVNYLLAMSGTAMVRVSPNVLNKQESANATAIAEEIVRATTTEGKLGAQISAIGAGASVEFALSQVCVLKNVATDVSVNVSMGAVVPEQLTLMNSDGTIIAEKEGNDLSAVVTVNSAEDITLIAQASYSDLEIRETMTIAVRNPVYVGFGLEANDVATVQNRVPARTTAAGLYEATANVEADAENPFFFILVPDDVTAPMTFAMGGVPFVMEESEMVVEGVNYRVYKSGAKYPDGVKLTINVM